jgi:hypothetical protein
MKTRGGFVSNSSSSSYIISCTGQQNPMLTTAQVALSMIGMLKAEYMLEADKNNGLHPHGHEWLDNRLKDFQSATNLLGKYQNFDGPIEIPWSINYETYIYRSETTGHIQVDTCDNNDWHLTDEFDGVFFMDDCDGCVNDPHSDLSPEQEEALLDNVKNILYDCAGYNHVQLVQLDNPDVGQLLQKDTKINQSREPIQLEFWYSEIENEDQTRTSV